MFRGGIHLHTDSVKSFLGQVAQFIFKQIDHKGVKFNGYHLSGGGGQQPG